MIKASSNGAAGVVAAVERRETVDCSLSAKLTAAPRLLNLDKAIGPHAGPGNAIRYNRCVAMRRPNPVTVRAEAVDCPNHGRAATATDTSRGKRSLISLCGRLAQHPAYSELTYDKLLHDRQSSGVQYSSVSVHVALHPYHLWKPRRQPLPAGRRSVGADFIPSATMPHVATTRSYGAACDRLNALPLTAGAGWPRWRAAR